MNGLITYWTEWENIENDTHGMDGIGWEFHICKEQFHDFISLSCLHPQCFPFIPYPLMPLWIPHLWRYCPNVNYLCPLHPPVADPGLDEARFQNDHNKEKVGTIGFKLGVPILFYWAWKSMIGFTRYHKGVFHGTTTVPYPKMDPSTSSEA